MLTIGKLLLFTYMTLKTSRSISDPNQTHFSNDYCFKRCPTHGEHEKNGSEYGSHTMCKYQGTSTGCIRYTVTYTPELGMDMLDWHNSFRNNFAMKLYPFQELPRAANMRLMSWDNELATMVHRWISQCSIDQRKYYDKMPTDECRDTDEYMVGQNVWPMKMFKAADTPLHLPTSKAIFDLWASTSRSMKAWYMFRWDNRHRGGHAFARLIWASIIKVGCSEVTFEHKNVLTRVFGCNYAPEGLQGRSPAYLKGFPCELCPNETICGIHPKYPHLCGTEEDLVPADFKLYLTVKRKAVTAPTHQPEDFIDSDSVRRTESSHPALLVLWLFYKII